MLRPLPYVSITADEQFAHPTSITGWALWAGGSEYVIVELYNGNDRLADEALTMGSAPTCSRAHATTGTCCA